MEQVLFIVHMEDIFRGSMRYWLPEDILEKSEEFDRVIVLKSNFGQVVPELEHFETWEWSWGYEPEHFVEEEEARWVIPAYCHEYTWVPPEIRCADEWKGKALYVCGGNHHECLQDWCDVLKHVGLEYGVLMQLTY